MRCCVHGPRGIGKHALALNLAQALLCEAPRPTASRAGLPGLPLRDRRPAPGPHAARARRRSIPTMARWQRSTRSRIDRMRALTEFVQLTSHRQRAKVAVIAPGRAHERRRGERAAEDAGGAAAGDLSHSRLRPAGTRAADDPLALPQARGAVAVAGRGARVARGARRRVARARARAGRRARRSRRSACADPARAKRAPRVDRLRSRARASFRRPALAARIDAGGKDERKPRLAHAVDWLIAWSSDLARVARRRRRAAESRRRRSARAARATGGADRAVSLSSAVACGSGRLLSHPLQPRLVAEALLIDYKALF